MSEREDTPFALALEAVSAQLSAVLPGLGFAPEPLRVTEPSGWRRQWIRDRSWARDVVDVPYRRGGEIAILINLQVELPIGDSWQVFDGRGVSPPRIPTWFAASRVDRYARNVAFTVRRECRWFEQFQTPARALRAAASPERNQAKAGPVFESMMAHLQHERDRLAAADRETLAP